MIHSWIVGRLFLGAVFSRRSQPDMHSHAVAERARNTNGGSFYRLLPKISYMPGAFR